MKPLFILFMILFQAATIIKAQNANQFIPSHDTYLIQNAEEFQKGTADGYLFVNTKAARSWDREQLQVNKLEDDTQNKQFEIKPSANSNYMLIELKGTMKCLALKGGKDNNGTRVIIANKSNDKSQFFKLMYIGNGKFKIVSECGRVLAMSNCPYKKGSEVVIWDDVNNSCVEWVIISEKSKKALNLESCFGVGDTPIAAKPKNVPTQQTNTTNQQTNAISKEFKMADMTGIRTFYIQSALCYGKNLKGFFDTPGGKAVSGINVQLYTLGDNLPDRKYRLKQLSPTRFYYNICVSSDDNIVLDLDGEKFQDGANLYLFNKRVNGAQSYHFRYMGQGRFKIYTSNPNFVVGVTKSAIDGSNVVMLEDQNNPWVEWYLIDSETNEPFIPKDVTEGLWTVKSNDADIVSTLEEVNTAYSVIKSVENSSSNALFKIENLRSMFDKSNILIDRVGSFTSKVNSTQQALEPFRFIPYVGNAIKALQTGMEVVGSKLELASNGLNALKAKVVVQAYDNLNYSHPINMLFNSQIKFAKFSLMKYSKYIAHSDTAEANSKKIQFTSIKENVSKIKQLISANEKGFNDIIKSCDKLDNVQKPINDFDKGLKVFDNGLKPVDRVAGEINNVLDKQFKKDIGKIKIRISVRDIISGKKLQKIFAGPAQKFAKGLIDKLLKKLNIKIPSVPGSNAMENALNSAFDITKQIRANSEEINKLSLQLNSLTL